MIAPINLAELAPPAQKMASPEAPEKLKLMAARGVAPGIKPADLVALLLVLSKSDLPEVQKTAKATLAALPEPVLQGALAADLQPEAIHALAPFYTGRTDVLDRLMRMPRISVETIEEIARTGDEATTELVAVNEDRLLKHPTIIERLYLNKATRMSTADRLIDLAARNGVTLSGIAAFKEAVIALKDELIPEPSPEPTPDDELFNETEQIATELTGSAAPEDTHTEDEEGNEKLKDKFLPLYQRVANMTMSQKIRRAMLGTREERMLLVRDNNRVVATAAIRSPMIQEPEVALIARNRNIPDEVLRIIGNTSEWLKSYSIKRALVENPKTPVAVSTKLVQHLRESDLRQIAKSKNVTSPVQEAARRHLGRRQS